MEFQLALAFPPVFPNSRLHFRAAGEFFAPNPALARIWILCPYASPTSYGWHSRPYVMAKALVSLGHRVSVFAFTASHYLRLAPSLAHIPPVEVHQGVEFNWFRSVLGQSASWPARIINWLAFNRSLRSFLKGYRGPEPQALVLSSPSIAHFALAPVLSKHFPKAVITLEIRDIWPLSAELLGANRFPPIIWWLRRCERLGMGHAHHVIGLMPGIGEYLAANFPWFPAASVYFIPHTLDGQEHLHMADKMPVNGDYFLGYAGTLGRANHLAALMEALVMLHDKGIDPPILIIGTGQALTKLKQAAAKLTHVHFVGWKSRPETLKLLAQCAVCYDGFYDIPLYRYGFSRLKWVDYFLVKKPVIASYSGQLLEFHINDFGWQLPAESPGVLAQLIMDLYRPGSEEMLRTKGENAHNWLIANRNSELLSQRFAHIVTSHTPSMPC